MTHRNLILGALATTLAVAAPAGAHNAVATPSCTGVDVVGSRFAPGPNPVNAVVEVDGEIQPPVLLELVNGQVATIPLDLAVGEHAVRVRLSWTLPDHVRAPYVAGEGVVSCVRTVAPSVAPEPAPEPAAPPEVLIEPPVVTPWVRVSLPPRRSAARPRYRCPAPLPSRGWQRIVWRRHRVLCPLAHPPTPRRIPVAG